MTDDDDDIPDATAPVMLTLMQVHRAVQEGGIEIAYSTLSELLKVGDTSSLLGGGGTGGKRSFPPTAPTILVEFIPLFKREGHKNQRFAEELRRWLAEREPVAVPEESSVVVAETGLVRQAPLDESEMAMLLARVQGYEQGLAETDEILTAAQAAKMLHCSTKTLRKSLPPVRRLGDSPSGDRWTRSQIMRHFQPSADLLK